MRKLVFASYFGLIFLLVISIYFLTEGDPEFVPLSNISSNSSNNKIIFVSDSQDPIWVETFLLDENQNIKAKKMIFDKIVRSSPSAVFHLGDLVAFGFWKTDWELVDEFTGQLASENIEFYPIIGNHEVMFFSDAGKMNFMERYPYHSETGYSVRKKNLGVILLNSNFSSLSDEQIEEQNRWYKNQLEQFENDGRIDFIVIGVHHSPFTNSKIVGTNKEVEKYFVPAYLNSKKARLFLSGHSHAFEHFESGGKDFLVIGGGGGLQQPLYKGEDEIFKDLFDSITQKRMFHFVEMTFSDDSLKFELQMMKKDFSGFEKAYTISIGKIDNEVNL